MDFRILGPVEVVDGDRPIDLGRPKQRAVLSVLLVQTNRVVSLDRLIDLLWGDTDVPRATAALRVYIANLRKALEPGRPPRTPSQRLVTQAPGYRLQVASGEVDAARFETLVAHGRALLGEGRAAGARAELGEALSLWRGPVLADFADEPFVRVESARLDQVYAAAIEDRLEADLMLGDHATVVADAEALVRRHPLRERLWALLAVSLYRAGRQGEAVRACSMARKVLVEELGIDPGPALQRVEGEILAQSPTLDWRPPPLEPTAVVATSVGSVDDPSAAVVGTDASGFPGRAPLVGRHHELAVLLAALGDTRRGSGRVALVSGEPGIGKTRLVEELAAAAGRSGVTVAWGRGQPADGAPAYWPWVEALSAIVDTEDPVRVGHALGEGAGDIAQLVPQVKELVEHFDPPPPLDPPAARFRLHQAISGFLWRLSADHPVAVVLDDVHWADVGSLQLMASVAAGVADHGLLLVATYRDVDAGDAGNTADEGLDGLLAALARQSGLVRIALRGLSAPDVACFIAQATQVDPSVSAAAAVHARTEGNPFFVAELARLLVSEGALATDDVSAATAGPVPTGVRDVLRRRLGRLGPATNDLLAVAAVVGRDFDLEVVADAGDFDDDPLDLVDPAVATGLVGEVEGVVGRYRFSHALVQQTVYDELSSLRRARLHGRVGRAIETLHGDDDARAIELANHFFHAATVGECERALAYAGKAAALAMSKLAYERAEDHLARAIGLLQRLPPSRERAERELETHVQLSVLLVRTKGYAATELGLVAARARELCREAGDSRAVLAALSTLALFSFARGKFDECDVITAQLVEISDSSADLAFGCAATHWQGQLAFVRGRFGEAARYMARATSLADGLDPTVRVEAFPQPPEVTSRTVLAQILAFMGDDDEARRVTLEAVSVAERLADPFSLCVALTVAAGVLGLLGDLDEARDAGGRARRLAAEHVFPVFVASATIAEGFVLAEQGHADVAVTQIADGLAAYDARGMRMRRTSFLAVLAHAHSVRGSYDEGLALVDEALDEVADRGERFYEAELHRLRGELLARRRPECRDEAEASLRVAIAVAATQGAGQFRRRAEATLGDLGLPSPV